MGMTTSKSQKKKKSSLLPTFLFPASICLSSKGLYPLPTLYSPAAVFCEKCSTRDSGLLILKVPVVLHTPDFRGDWSLLKTMDKYFILFILIYIFLYSLQNEVDMMHFQGQCILRFFNILIDLIEVILINYIGFRCAIL